MQNNQMTPEQRQKAIQQQQNQRRMPQFVAPGSGNQTLRSPGSPALPQGQQSSPNANMGIRPSRLHPTSQKMNQSLVNPQFSNSPGQSPQNSNAGPQRGQATALMPQMQFNKSPALSPASGQRQQPHSVSGSPSQAGSPRQVVQNPNMRGNMINNAQRVIQSGRGLNQSPLGRNHLPSQPQMNANPQMSSIPHQNTSNRPMPTHLSAPRAGGSPSVGVQGMNHMRNQGYGVQQFPQSSGFPGNVGGIQSHQRPPDNAPGDKSSTVLGKSTLQDLLRQVDPTCKMDSDVEQMFLEIADHFIDSVTSFSCQLAKHRKSKTLEAKDVSLHLERHWQIKVPGFGDSRPHKRLRPENHNMLVANVRQSAALEASHGSPAGKASGAGRAGQ